MPLYIRIINFVIDKEAVRNKYKGGVDQFRKDFYDIEKSDKREDDDLFHFNRTSSIRELTSLGFHYDNLTKSSTDFVVFHRYEGKFWEVDWLEDNRFFMWHKNTNPKLKEMALQFGEIRMNDGERVLNQGFDIFAPLTMESIATHPLSRLVQAVEN